MTKNGVPTSTQHFYMAAIKSFLGYHDIDVVPRIFKKKVGMPKHFREDEQAIDASDIRKILLKCTRRLKVYVLVLASGGLREIEALAIRNRDISFDVTPTKIHVRKEYAKTHVARNIYISDEATKELRDWIDWKYRQDGKIKKPDDLVFSVAPRRIKDYDPNLMYANIEREFIRILGLAGFTGRKENSRVHTITLRSFRRFVQSTISDTAGKDYAEWFLGHSKSPYYTKKESELRDIYSTKCAKYLTFLDYSLLEATGKSIDAELQVKDKQIQSLESRVESKDQEVQQLQEQMSKMQEGLKLYADHAKELTKEVFEKAKHEIDSYRKQLEEKDARRDVLYDMLDEKLPGWGPQYHHRLGWGGRPLNKAEREKLRLFKKQIEERIRNNPDNDDYYDND